MVLTLLKTFTSNEFMNDSCWFQFYSNGDYYIIELNERGTRRGKYRASTC